MWTKSKCSSLTHGLPSDSSALYPNSAQFAAQSHVFLYIVNPTGL